MQILLRCFSELFEHCAFVVRECHDIRARLHVP